MHQWFALDNLYYDKEDLEFEETPHEATSQDPIIIE